MLKFSVNYPLQNSAIINACAVIGTLTVKSMLWIQFIHFNHFFGDILLSPTSKLDYVNKDYVNMQLIYVSM